MANRNFIIPIPLGIDGVSSVKDPSRQSPGHLSKVNGVTLEDGILGKEGGSRKYNTSAISGSPSILGGNDWWPTSSTQRAVVLASDGKLYKDSGTLAFPTTLASSLSVSDITPVFVEGGKEAAANNRKLFVFTGKNQVQVLSGDGATTSALATPPADWSASNQPVFGLIHKDRLWGGGNANDPHRLYYSLTTNHEDFTTADAGSISVFPGEGEKLVGAVSFKGVIVAWKYPKGVYAIDTRDATISNWSVSRISQDFGLAGPRAVALIDDDILFVEPSGQINVVSALQEFGNLGSRTLSSAIGIEAYLRSNVSPNYTYYMQAVYYPSKRRVEIAAASKGSRVNNSRLLLDYNARSPRLLQSRRENPVSLWLRKDVYGTPRPVCGDDSGFVRLLDQDSRSEDGGSYTSECVTLSTDCSYYDSRLANLRKNGQALELVFAAQNGANISTIGVASEYNSSGDDNQPLGLFVGNSGARLYIAGVQNASVYEYTLSTVWDITTASLTNTLSVVGDEPNLRDVFFKTDGSVMYFIGLGDTIYEYSLSTAWDISSASTTGVTLSTASEISAPTALHFSSDGTKIYVFDLSGGLVQTYNLSTAWDLTTSSVGDTFTASVSIAYGTFSSDGTQMFLTDSTNLELLQYTLTTAWDITSAELNDVGSIAHITSAPFGVVIRDDLSQIIFSNSLGSTASRIYSSKLTNLAGVSVVPYWDGVAGETLSFTVGVNSANDTSDTTSRKHRLTGSGIRFSMKVFNNTAYENYSIIAAYLHVTVGDNTMPDVR